MMLFYISSTLLLACFYVFFMSLYAYYWRKLALFQLPENYMPRTFVSVLIPARNEADKIEHCLDSILKNNFPKNLLEIIVIDDHSGDDTGAVVERKIKNYPVIRLIELKNHLSAGITTTYKKKAIELAITEAKGDLIITTDADCTVPENWLSLITGFYETTSARFIAAPVNFHGEKNILEKFQSLDYIGMMGITGAGVCGGFMNMCNGANLAYEKKLFYEVGGFRGIDHIASGDDMLLMQKIAQLQPVGTIGFIKNKEAVVHSTAQPTVENFLTQRRRWASKSSSYTEWFTVFQLAVVLLFCASIFVNFILFFIFPSPEKYFLLPAMCVKIFADYFFLSSMTRFFMRRDLMRHFFPSQFLHIIYIVVVGCVSQLKKTYVWKGRRVK